MALSFSRLPPVARHNLISLGTRNDYVVSINSLVHPVSVCLVANLSKIDSSITAFITFWLLLYFNIFSQLLQVTCFFLFCCQTTYTPTPTNGLCQGIYQAFIYAHNDNASPLISITQLSGRSGVCRNITTFITTNNHFPHPQIVCDSSSITVIIDFFSRWWLSVAVVVVMVLGVVCCVVHYA